MPFKRILAAIPAFSIGIALAQAPAPIERVKITDNDLTCRANYDELQGLDKIIAEAKATQSSGQTTGFCFFSAHSSNSSSGTARWVSVT